MGRTQSRAPLIGAPPRPYTIYVITDTHIGSGGDLTLADKVRRFAERVTEDRPDMAIHLGDIYDTTDQRALFLSAWSRITGVYKKAILGNHEWDPDGLTDSDLEESLGYQEKVENGGSRFNQTFVLDGAGWPLRIILLDSTFNSSNKREKVFTNVRMHSDTPAWFESVLDEAEEEVILIFTHAGPHLIAHNYYADTDQANALAAIVDAKVSARPKTVVRWFFGHYHGGTVLPFSNLGAANLGYRCPTSLEGANGRMTVIRALPDRRVTVSKVELPQ